MARSFLRTPITGRSRASSDRPAKKLASRRYRTAVRRCLRQGGWEILPHPRELTDPWLFPKDGKSWVGYDRPGLLRK